MGELVYALFRSVGWLVQQVLQGKQRWDYALAFVAVPSIIGCALGWHWGGFFEALLFAMAGALVGVGCFWWFARHTSPGIDPAHLCELALSEGDYDEARWQYERSRELARRRGKPESIGIRPTSLCQLGKLAHLHEDTGKARLLYEQSLAIARQLGDEECIAISLHQLGVLARWRGDDIEARRLYEESLRIFAHLDSPYAETVRGNLTRLLVAPWESPVEI